MVRLFGHYVPRALVVFALIESLILLLAFYVSYFLRFPMQVENARVLLDLFPKAAIFMLIIAISLTATGMYQRHLRESLREQIARVGIGIFIGFILMSLFFYLIPDLHVGRGVLALGLGLSFAGMVVTRFIFDKALDRDLVTNHRVLVLGTGKHAALIDSVLRRKSDRRGFRVVDYVHMPATDRASGDESQPACNRLMAEVQQRNIDEIVVALDDDRGGLPVRALLDCKLSGVRVTRLDEFLERHAGKIMLPLVRPSSMVFTDGFRMNGVRSVSKRAFDLTVAITLLVLTSPILLLAMLAILFEDRKGGVWYRQTRVGEGSRAFTIYKLRSMRATSEQDGQARWAEVGDSRITRVGAFLRKYRIDELPQLINIIKGDMSVVGPRPERPEFVSELAKTIDYYQERHRVKPGLTGWAQICYPYGASYEDAVEKLQYDLYYVKHYSLIFDFLIILQTAQVVLWGRGAR